MKKSVKYLIITLMLIIFALSAGEAQENFYLYMNFRYPTVYPGETIEMGISGNLKSDIKKDIYKKATVRIYNITNKDILKGIKKSIESKNPLKKKNINLKFPYNNSEWFYANDRIKLEGLPAGMYAFRLSCENKDTIHQINVTRLGVITKSDHEKILIFVQDHKTGEPLPGVKLQLIDHNNKKTYYATSGSNGLKTVFFDELEGYKPGNSLQVLAEKGKDVASSYAYYYARSGEFKGYIYTDRPIYRPGQKVYIKGILRSYKDGVYSFDRGWKVKLTIRDPRGKEIKKAEMKTDQFGNISTDLVLKDKPPLGVYYITVDSGKGSATGSFKVEEYRKPEFEIIVKPGKDFYVQGDKVSAEIEAKYYFGSPVPNTDFTYEVRRSYYYPYYQSTYWWEEEYMSGRYGYGYGDTITNGKGKTGKDGKAKITFDSQKWNNDARYTIIVRMVDKSRREVTGSASTKVTRGAFYLYTSADRYFYETGDKIKLKIKATDYKGKPVETPFTIKIIRNIYKENKNISKNVLTKKLKTDNAGVNHYSFVPDSPGYYHVLVEAEDKNKNKISYTHYFYCSSEDAYYSWYNFTSIDVIQDKSFYDVGDTAKLFLTIPDKDAWVLVTVEGESIHKHEVIKFKGNSSVMKLNIPESYAPNVYISLTYFKNQAYRQRSKRIVIPDRKNFMTVKISHDKESYKPRQTATFTVETLDYKNNPLTAQVTMGVADESIYAVSPDTAPNIQKFFYGLKGNFVYTNTSYYNTSISKDKTDSYDDMKLEEGISDAAKPMSSVAKKEGRMRAKTRDARRSQLAQPDFVREFFPDTCYFNPNIITDNRGTAKVTVALPDSLTTWRATARGVTADTKVGEGTDKIIVRKELLVRLITPRFLTERDEVLITGIVHNYLKTEKEIVMELNVKGVELLSGSKAKVKVKPGDSAKVDWKVKADSIGEASFMLKGLTDEESDAMKLKIPVLPHGTEKYSAEAGATENKESISLELPHQSNQNTASLLVRISPSIASTIFPALKYLAGYPYGCVEQTMSRFMPTVIVAKTLRQFDIYDKKLNKELPKMVQKGLTRLYDFHHSDGGWGWWKDDKSHPYMTAYVVYGLSKAGEAGYQIRQDKVHQAVRWLEQNFEAQKDLNTQTYMLFAMSQAGKFHKQWALDLYSERNSLDNYSSALLALIFHKNGMKDNALEMIRILESSAEKTGTLCTWKGKTGAYGWTDNQVETTAYALMAFVKVKPESPLVTKAVRYLAFSRKGNRWYSTKDTAAAVMALSEYLKISKELKADYSGTVAVNGKILKQFTFTNKDVGGKGMEFRVPGSHLLVGKNTISFEKKGKGKLYFSAYLSHYTKEENIKAQDAGFKVKREYFLINQKLKEGDKNRLIPIKGDKVTLVSQDRIFVKLTVTGSADYEYVMIEDPKPAGCEITDKPQSSSQPGYHGKRRSYVPYHYAQKEIRDDKMVYFITRFNRGTNTFSYEMRAETPGEFHTMPTKASLMYIPEIGGISDEMIFNITEKTDNATRDLGKSTEENESKEGFWDKFLAMLEN